MKHIFIISIVLALSFASLGHAQAGPQLFITWSTSSYVPSFYEGKAFPSEGSRLKATLAVFQQNSFIDLSKEPIFWYINGTLVQNILGEPTFEFDVPPELRDSLTLRAQLPEHEGSVLSKSITIPLLRPEVVIDAPFPDNTFSTRAIEFAAHSFFFNINTSSELDFSWKVNGEEPLSFISPEILKVNVDSAAQKDSKIQISLSARDEKTGQSRSATKSLIFR